MDEIIEHVKESTDKKVIRDYLDEIIKRVKESTDEKVIRDYLDELLQPKYEDNEYAQLFCQQMQRLMNYNRSLRQDIWNVCTMDLYYIIEDPLGKEDKYHRWEKFIERMNYEKIIRERELKFEERFGNRKSFDELFDEHEDFLIEYCQNCISFHSKLQLRTLVNNSSDLASMIEGLIGTSLSSQSQQDLENKLKFIQIDLNSSKKILKVYSKKINNNFNNFQPSLKQNISTEEHLPTEKLTKVFENDRWIVILGDPGSGKTTLLRWLTQDSARTILDNELARVPILIRIGEFVSWLKQNPTKTLIDYIGNHTWFSQSYSTTNQTENILQEFIYHGHALILLDGLDEIPDVAQRKQIVDSVRSFIDEYVQANDSVSAFDQLMFETNSDFSNKKVRQMQTLDTPGANQILITSRIVGYEFYPLIGANIRTFILSLMDQAEVKEFIQKWAEGINKIVFDHLEKENIQMDNEIKQYIFNQQKNDVDNMFKVHSHLSVSNPSLLSLICACHLSLSTEFHAKSRVEMYEHLIETIIPQVELKYFLMKLAVHLHLQSPSGLIDEFDMRELCCSIRKQQVPSAKRHEIRDYVDRLLSSLNSDIGILAERGLQVFSFVHLSFQEYFVSQALIQRESNSIVQIVKRILTFTINPRFRESLHFTLGWVSAKWSSNDYDEFCRYLLTLNLNYAIPVGTLLFFDSFQDLKQLPSETIVFTALNNLLRHPSWDIRSKYLLKYLCQLKPTMIQHWIELYLNDEQSIEKFFQSFLIYYNKRVWISNYASELTPFTYQLLSSRLNRSQLAKFHYDQLLRRLVASNSMTKQIFNKNLSKYTLSSIHPLIIATINALCGGIHFKLFGGQFHLSFSLQYTYCESSALTPIIEYLDNRQQNHIEKLPKLIETYENLIQNYSQSNTSIDLIDLFVALICLRGLSQISIYEKYKDFQAFSLALHKFKSIWFYYNQTCDFIRDDVGWMMNVHFIEKQIQPIMKTISSEQRISTFSSAFAEACKKLRLLDVENRIYFNSSQKIKQFIPNQSEFLYFIDEHKLKSLAENISELDQCYLLNYLPKSLRLLYSYTILETNSLPFIILLLECLANIESVEEFDANFYLSLIMLKPLLEKYSLENYAIGLLWEKYFDKSIKSNQTKEFLQAIKNRKLLDRFYIDQVDNLQSFIDIEYVKLLSESEDESKICAASISLIRLLRTQYHLKHIGNIPSIYYNTIYFAIMNLEKSPLKISIINFILTIKTPLFFEQHQTNELQTNLVDLFKSLSSSLSLSVSTLLFLQSKKLLNELYSIISNKFNNQSNHERQIAFIALEQSQTIGLSYCLSEYAKQQNNLSDILHFNSTIFYDFINRFNSFESSNSVLLSIFYLNELCLDGRYLNIFLPTNAQNDLLSWIEFDEFQNQLSQPNPQCLSVQMGKLITNYLRILNRNEIQEIIDYLPKCLFIEKDALPIIETWLDYKEDKSLDICAQFAALQMIIEGSIRDDLLITIERIFPRKNAVLFTPIIERLFNSEKVNSNIFDKLLSIIHKNHSYFWRPIIFMNCQRNLQLILDFQSKQSKIPVLPILLLIKSCSKDLQIYLVDYLHEKTSNISNIHQENYIAVACKWVTELFILKDLENGYEHILTFLHNKTFPQIQKAILLGLNLVFLRINRKEQDHYYLQDKVIINLETIIYSWRDYSPDILALCLLVYGNYLIRLNNCNVNRKIPELVEETLTLIYEQLFPKIEISAIRAKYCLIFMENKMDHLNSNLLTWFDNKSNLTIEQKYLILLNQTLYEIRERSSGISIEELVNFVRQYSDEVLDRFILDVYNYLCDREDKNYLSDQLYDYVILALKVQENGWDKFYKAIKKFGENKFKKQLCIHCMNYPQDGHYSLIFYKEFGYLTEDLLELIEKREHNDGLSTLRGIKQVSNVNAVKKFMKQLDSNTSDKLFGYYADVLISLARMHNVSLLEMHHEISDFIKKSRDIDEKLYSFQQDLFTLLLKISCFDFQERFNPFDMINVRLHNTHLNTEKQRSNLERIFPNKHTINRDFQKEIQYLDKKSALFFPDNPFYA